MAAKSTKRHIQTKNKQLEFDKIQLKDIICSICQSVLSEPVTLPCIHTFCLGCFNSSVENNALCCPLCRMRIGSWLRTATKQNTIVDVKLWEFIKSKFSHEVSMKSKGEDLNLSQEQPTFRLSKPGEIRGEYETEVKKHRAERQQLEQKQMQESAALIRKIQEEEKVIQKKYIGLLKQDEVLARQIQNEHKQSAASSKEGQPRPQARLKSVKIDAYLSSKTRISCFKKVSPIILDDSTTSTITNGATPSPTAERQGSPEIVPSYCKYLKNNRKGRIFSFGFWNKENGDKCKTKISKKPAAVPQPQASTSVSVNETVEKMQTSAQTLPVSLPYSGILKHKINTIDKRFVTSNSADSMREEMCYFKPVQGTTVTSFNAKRGLPLRVPAMRLEKPPSVVPVEPPACTQYVEGLSVLRSLSLAKNLPSAFVIALKKQLPTHNQPPVRSRVKTRTVTSSEAHTSGAVTRSTVPRGKAAARVEGISKLDAETTLRRSQSLSSVTKNENETTPKKAKTKLRQASSERKPYLRSDSKKHAKNLLNSPPLNPDSVNNNKINLAVKNLSSPLQHCDVKKMFEDQLRIVKKMEQEKSDYEVALKMDADLNGHLRRPAVKRHVPLGCARRPAKKLKA